MDRQRRPAGHPLRTAANRRRLQARGSDPNPEGRRYGAPHPAHLGGGVIMSTATPTQPTALQSPADAANRQARHALTALARTTPGRRRVIQAAAEEYLSQ